MYNCLSVSKNTSFKRLVYGYLLASIDIYCQNQHPSWCKEKKISLHQGKDNHRILYISGAALQLAKSHHQQAMEIAQAIVNQLAENSESIFKLQIQSPGWIHLELSDAVLATWLQNWVAGNYQMRSPLPEAKVFTKIYNPARLFAMQYAHARCCSVISLAHREGLIKLKTSLSENHDPQESFVTTELIPWLDSNAKVRLTHPAERSLITEIVKTIDELDFCEQDHSSIWEKIGLNLSQAFEVFWCHCRIWGEVKTSDLELTQARLGLLIITQSILHLLLTQKLQAVAPVEL